MDIVFNCPHCNLEIEVDQEAAGQEFDCPTCQKTLTVPDASGPSGGGLPAASPANPPPSAKPSVPPATTHRSGRTNAWRCR